MAKILHVEDEESIRVLVRHEFEDLGHEIITQKNGNGILDRIVREEPDVVILDINLGNESGLDLLHLIKRRFTNLPVILHSAYVQHKGTYETFEADYYVVKTHDFSELIGKVNRCLETRSANGIPLESSGIQNEDAALGALRASPQRSVPALPDSQGAQLDLSEFGKMIAGISHDLVSAVGLMQTTISYLLHDPQGGNRLKEDLGRMALVSKYCNLLLGNLSHLVQGSGTHKTPVDFIELIEEVLEILSSKIPSEVEVTRSFDSDVPQIAADRAQLQRAFMNVVENSIHAMPDGGTLSIQVAHEQTSGSLEKERAVLVRISDTGVGIPRRDLNSIFDLSFSTKREGYGLGLYIVRQVVEIHGGRVSVESLLGRGATFILRIPEERSNS